MSRPVPFVDLAGQHDEIADDLTRSWARVLASGAFIGGPEVRAFEAEFAHFCGRVACVGVGNGTDAVEIALRGLGIGAGHEVVVPVNTFVATAEAVVRCGARPVFVDCDADTLLIDPEQAAAAVGPRTRAVIGVDLYGQIAPFDALAEVVRPASRVPVEFVEDAAQSQGATRFGTGIGAGVAAAATSFYPGKNLGAYGDAGGIVTDDVRLAERMRQIANHGGSQRYEHRVLGLNSRLDAVQAGVLRLKLERLAGWNAARRAAADRYDGLLARAGVTPGVERVATAPGNEHVWHLYVVRVPEAVRDRVLARFEADGIGTGIHYPTPIHLTPAFGWWGGSPGDFPVAETSCRRIVSLPMHPHLTADDQERVVAVLAAAL